MEAPEGLLPRSRGLGGIQNEVDQLSVDGRMKRWVSGDDSVVDRMRRWVRGNQKFYHLWSESKDRGRRFIPFPLLGR